MLKITGTSCKIKTSYCSYSVFLIAMYCCSLNINVRRLGGAYGAKISRATQICCACALVCYKLNRPARFVMSIEGNMMAIGKRVDTRQEYEIGVDDSGRIQYLETNFWANSGCSFNEMHAGAMAEHIKR